MQRLTLYQTIQYKKESGSYRVFVFVLPASFMFDSCFIVLDLIKTCHLHIR